MAAAMAEDAHAAGVHACQGFDYPDISPTSVQRAKEAYAALTSAPEDFDMLRQNLPDYAFGIHSTRTRRRRDAEDDVGGGRCGNES